MYQLGAWVNVVEMAPQTFQALVAAADTFLPETRLSIAALRHGQEGTSFPRAGNHPFTQLPSGDYRGRYRCSCSCQAHEILRVNPSMTSRRLLLQLHAGMALIHLARRQSTFSVK